MSSTPLEKFEHQVKKVLKESLDEIGIEAEIPTEVPPYGIADLAIPLFGLSKPAKEKEIHNVFERILKISGEKVASGNYDWIESVEKKGMYLNFKINPEKLSREVISEVITKGMEYGTLSGTGEKILLEHTSANPSGPLHVGRARNPIIGDTIARILRKGGHRVETQFYVDDVGKQVAILTWGVKNILKADSSGSEETRQDRQLVTVYQRANSLMEEDSGVKSEINALVRKFEQADKDVLEEARKAYSPILEGIINSLAKLNIRFDSFKYESEFILDGSSRKVVERLKQSGEAMEEEGAFYIPLAKYGVSGDNPKFFFTRNDGTTLYVTRDIAYHLWKAKQADLLINVLGEDHRLEAKQVELALDLCGEKNKPRTVFYAFVSLEEGRMSTRKGRVVYLDDLMEESIDRAYREVKKRRPELGESELRKIAEVVGLGAIRYNLIKVQPEKAIKFKWNEALNFEGDSAPFIQYAHARCSSILKKARSSDADLQAADFHKISHPHEIDLVKKIANFPKIISQVAENLRTNQVAGYTFELAVQLNQFYRDCRVIGSGENEKPRLALVRAAAQVLKNSLAVLGIEAPEQM